jgi:hypothetical protein
MISYLILLKKYMSKVIDKEGVSFVDDDPPFPLTLPLSEEEREVLRAIEKEIPR